MAETVPPLTMDTIVSLCRRRGFVFPSSEIYGGIGSTYDYGHYGVLTKNNIRSLWFRAMVQERDDIVALDSAIILNPRVWEASGHVDVFTDPLVDCRTCKLRFRADQLELASCGRKPSKHPGETPDCDLTEARKFNLMFQTHVGALQDSSSVAYLRPETAQGIFVNFKNVLDSTRLKLPFGVAQVGKAFRNEINPRNYTFRSREFEQMEIEFFCRPEESMKWYQWWRDVRIQWYSKLGIRSERLRPREQGKEELAHYSVGTTDIEYLFPFSEEPQELEGVAHRADYDLQQHMKHSGKDLSYFDEELWQKADKSAYGGDKKKEQEAKSKPPYRFVPHVIEPSAGADRFTLAVLCEAYTEDKVPDEKGVPQERIVMKFHPRLAPVKAAILPLVNKEGMPDIAHKLYRELKTEFNVFYDDGGAVGRRYRRQDEIGTPYCFTIDGQTLQDQTVTLRDRDTTRQSRLALSGVA